MAIQERMWKLHIEMKELHRQSEQLGEECYLISEGFLFSDDYEGIAAELEPKRRQKQAIADRIRELSHSQRELQGLTEEADSWLDGLEYLSPEQQQHAIRAAQSLLN